MGNSVETVDYAFTHDTPNVGDNYYRLRQVDYDGSFEYSNVVVVNRAGENNVSIRPNITKGQVNVFIQKGYTRDTRGVIYDLLGSQVMDVVIPANSNQQTIDVQHLPKGHYLFRLQEGSNMEVIRFVKMD
ncbi:MAG: T9SS type A sorting domain-containing protein [Bacteroidota bacterium]